MHRAKFGKWLLTFVLVMGAVGATGVDWNATHLFNPLWHPHARFHDALFILIVDAMSAIAVWLLWRKSKEPEVALKVAGLSIIALWTPFIYVEKLVPGSSLLANQDVPVPTVAGVGLPPNLIIALVLLFLGAVAYWMAREPRRRG